MSELQARLMRETVMYRKDAEVTEKTVGGVHVVEVFGYPETPSRGELVDVHFVNVGFTEAAADPDGFITDLNVAVANDGEFCNLGLDDLRGGPSYITLGSWLGSQDLALRFIALGAHYGYWDAITPATLRITGEIADLMAGNGMVMASGLRS